MAGLEIPNGTPVSETKDISLSDAFDAVNAIHPDYVFKAILIEVDPPHLYFAVTYTKAGTEYSYGEVADHEITDGVLSDDIMQRIAKGDM